MTIRKILFVMLWLCIGGGMFILLMAAINNQNKGRCADYRILISGDRRNLFIDEKDVEELLVKTLGGSIRGRLISSFNLHALEQALEKDKWIENAELYFDNQDLLHIKVLEREPVARVFTADGASFYIDSSGKTLPLSDKLSARVPVFTGFPSRVFNRRDSALLQEVRSVANFVYNDSFWMAQVAQVDITPAGRFELIPVVGSHLVRLGDGTDVPSKFRRLMIFYQQVLSKTGLEKYKLIDVQFRGQVVASRYLGDPRIDSVQLRKNVLKLLQASWESANDTVIRALPPLVKLEPDSAIAPDPSLVDRESRSEGGTADEIKAKDKNKVEKGREDKVKEKKESADVKDPAAGEKKPKAVMPKRNQ